MSKSRAIVETETKVETIWFYLLLIFFKKTKRGLELVSLLHFLPDFWRKIFLTLYSIQWPNFIFWLPLHFEMLSNMCIAIVCYPVCDVIKFEIDLNIFQRDQKSQEKNISKTQFITFHHFQSAFIEANKANFFEDERTTFMGSYTPIKTLKLTRCPFIRCKHQEYVLLDCSSFWFDKSQWRNSEPWNQLTEC